MSATGADWNQDYIPAPFGSDAGRENVLSIRTAEMDDLMAVAEILAESFHGRAGFYNWFYPVMKLGIYEDIRNRMLAATSGYFCLVATNTNALRGECLLGTVEVAVRSPFFWQVGQEKPYVYVSNLAVDLDYRRQGIARKLLEACEVKASQWGFKEIYLHVLDNNQEARQLYLKLGYQFKQAESSWSWLWFKQPNRILLSKSLK